MNHNIFSFIILPIIVLVTMAAIRHLRNKIYQPKFEDEVQRPGILQKFVLNLIKILDILAILFVLLGLYLGEIEMTIAFAVLAFIFSGAIMILNHAYDTSYLETDEYFIIKLRNQEHKVNYDDIIDWQPSFNEIKILDQTKADRKYIPVNIALFKPEILLRQLADKAFAGEFHQQEKIYSEDPDRKVETINYLRNNQYGYLVKDYIEEIENGTY